MTKLAWYASIGVPEYWLVDPDARTLERLVLHGERYVIADALSDGALFATFARSVAGTPPKLSPPRRASGK